VQPVRARLGGGGVMRAAREVRREPAPVEVGELLQARPADRCQTCGQGAAVLAALQWMAERELAREVLR
jgi:hypothetical protein